MKIKTLEYFEKLLEEEYYNPTIIFSVRSSKQAKEDKRYKFHIFNHVSLCFPFNAEIVEASGGLCCIKQSSSYKYQDFDGVKVILPLFIRPFDGGKDGVDFRYDKDMPDEYGNCADFVRKYLVKAGILKDKKGKISVDELYFELMQNGLIVPAKILNDWHFKKRDEEEMKPKPEEVKALKEYSK